MCVVNGEKEKYVCGYSLLWLRLCCLYVFVRVCVLYVCMCVAEGGERDGLMVGLLWLQLCWLYACVCVCVCVHVCACVRVCVMEGE